MAMLAMMVFLLIWNFVIGIYFGWRGYQRVIEGERQAAAEEENIPRWFITNAPSIPIPPRVEPSKINQHPIQLSHSIQDETYDRDSATISTTCGTISASSEASGFSTSLH